MKRIKQLEEIKKIYNKRGFLLSNQIEVLEKNLDNGIDILETIELVILCNLTLLFNKFYTYLKGTDKYIISSIIRCFTNPVLKAEYIEPIINNYDNFNIEIKKVVIFNIGYSIKFLIGTELLEKIKVIMNETFKVEDFKFFLYNSLAVSTDLDILSYKNYIAQSNIDNIDILFNKFEDQYCNDYKMDNIDNLMIYNSTFDIVNSILYYLKHQRVFSTIVEEINKDFLKLHLESFENILSFINKLPSFEELEYDSENIIGIIGESIRYYIRYSTDSYEMIRMLQRNDMSDFDRLIVSKYHINSDIKAEGLCYVIGFLELIKYYDLIIWVLDNEESYGVKSRLLFNLGYIIDKLNKDQQKEIAKRILNCVSLDYDENVEDLITPSYHSILVSTRTELFKYPDLSSRLSKYQLNLELIFEFEKKYIKKSKSKKNHKITFDYKFKYLMNNIQFLKTLIEQIKKHNNIQYRESELKDANKILRQFKSDFENMIQK